jgi:hypothetical protein
VIWESKDDAGDPLEGDKCATVDLDFGPNPGPKQLVLRHLDGLADDSFDVFVQDGGNFLKVGHYTDVSPTEIWKTFILSVDPSLTGVHTVKLCATAAAKWTHWNTYGQVGFDWIEVCPGGCDPLFGYVDIGNPSSEAGHNLQGWGPIEPDTNDGNWGGFDVTGEDCRVIWSDDEESPDPDPGKCATVELDFGCLEGPKMLVLRHLDGLADDSFDVYIDGVFLGHYTDVSPTEVWNTVNFPVPSNLTGIHTVKLCATATAKWTHWDTWGQVGFDWIKVCGRTAMYWKAAYPDYAPNGMPDFDQKQDLWGKGEDPEAEGWRWTYCGPTAVANCLWWFDSKFEPNPMGPLSGPPGTIPINDNYSLVQSYPPVPAPWDDHDPQNVMPLINDLAARMHTDGQGVDPCAWSGTKNPDLEEAIDEYLFDHGLHRHFYRHTEEMPDFWWVEEELYQSENVILLLGFYWCDGEVIPEEEWPHNCQPVPTNGEYTTGDWFRAGGHYVTVAGVDSKNMEIAFSDPYRDNAEPPTNGLGRWLSGMLTAHTPPHGSGQHNDAGNVSHDVYQVMWPSPSPGGLWGLWDYANPGMVENFALANPYPTVPPLPYPPESQLPVFTEVEKAIVISPKPLLKVEPRHETIGVCEEIDIDVEIIANEMCGVQFDLEFDPTLLEVIDADSDPGNGTQISVGDMWASKSYLVIDNEVNGGTIEFGAFLLGSDCPSDFHWEQVAQIRFHGIGDGVSPLNLNNVTIGAPEAEPIEPVYLKDGTLTVTTDGTIQGIVEVQGRPGDWDGAQITVSGGPGGPYNATVMNSNGTWSISGVLAGTYQVEVEMARYLDGLKTGVTVSAGGTTNVGQVKVLGGDCNDDDGVQPGPPYGVDISDAILVGGAFGTSPPSNPAADVNDSGNVDILDAILVGQNWWKSSPVPWP